MIISSTSAFQFLKFQKHHFLIYLSVWPLHVKCTLARHLSHSRIRFDVILVYNRSLVELTTRSWEMRSTSKLLLGNYVVLYQGVSGRLIIIQSIMYWAIITFHNHLYDMIVIDISILSSFDEKRSSFLHMINLVVKMSFKWFKYTIVEQEKFATYVQKSISVLFWMQ